MFAGGSLRASMREGSRACMHSWGKASASMREVSSPCMREGSSPCMRVGCPGDGFMETHRSLQAETVGVFGTLQGSSTTDMIEVYIDFVKHGMGLCSCAQSGCVCKIPNVRMCLVYARAFLCKVSHVCKVSHANVLKLYYTFAKYMPFHVLACCFWKPSEGFWIIHKISMQSRYKSYTKAFQSMRGSIVNILSR